MNKNEILGYIVLVIMFGGTCLYTLKVKGKQALITLIQKAEYIFDWKGAGKQKAEYVLQQAQRVVPIPFKYFVTLDTISRLVETLQPDFKEVREFKKSSDYNNMKK